MLIKELEIFSSNINIQKEFYVSVLGLKVLREEDNLISFSVGKSILTLVYRESTTPYHFAFNIPAHKDEEALQWLKSRLPILKFGDIEIQDFASWNAKAIYFYDKENNILELISRNNLKNESTKKFNSDQYLEISEIGIPSADITKIFNQLNRHTGVAIYDGSLEQFCAIGDEEGLFICINKNIRNWFPVGDKAYSSDFKLKFNVGSSEFLMEYKNDEIKINSGFKG